MDSTNNVIIVLLYYKGPVRWPLVVIQDSLILLQ